MLTEITLKYLAARELAATRNDGECLLSTFILDADGYRESKYQGRYVGMAHRIVFLAAGNTIPDGYTLDHLCRQRACLNVAHLEPVTLAENLRRARAFRAAALAERGTCSQGHPWTDESRYVHRGTSYCRICNRAAKARQKMAVAS